MVESEGHCFLVFREESPSFSRINLTGSHIFTGWSPREEENSLCTKKKEDACEG